MLAVLLSCQCLYIIFIIHESLLDSDRIVLQILPAILSLFSCLATFFPNVIHDHSLNKLHLMNKNCEKGGSHTMDLLRAFVK